MGRYICGAGGNCTGFGVVSLIAYIVASKICGSTVIVQLPSFVIESLAGLSAGWSGSPFFFFGLVQYFSKIPSLSHFCLDLCRDSTRTPLRDRSASIIFFKIQDTGPGMGHS